MTTLIFSVFMLLIASGMPIVFSLGVTAAAFLAASGVPLNTVAQRMVAGLDSFPLMAIPFFVLAGLIMERGGIARRIVEFASALVGWITGSLLLIAIIAGTGFAAVSGSGSASTAAISSIMLPEMRRRGYNIDFSANTLAAAGVLGPIIPPSIMMIVLATCSPVPLSVEDLFVGAVVPGLIMSVGLMIHAWRFATKGGAVYREEERFSLQRLARTAASAVPAFFMPIIIVGGIIGGLFTPTEAAAIAVFAGLFIGIFVYRELKWRELPRILVRAACVSASIMMIIATASVFSWLVASNRIPDLMARQMLALSSSAWVFLLLLNVLLFIIGMFMESNSAILILIPVIMPVAVHHLGIDPVHLGVLVTCNLCVGMITPPYGICLFVASSISGRTVAQLNRHVWGFVTVFVAVLVLMTYVPAAVTWLPSLLH